MAAAVVSFLAVSGTDAETVAGPVLARPLAPPVHAERSSPLDAALARAANPAPDAAPDTSAPEPEPEPEPEPATTTALTEPVAETTTTTTAVEAAPVDVAEPAAPEPAAPTTEPETEPVVEAEPETVAEAEPETVVEVGEGGGSGWGGGLRRCESGGDYSAVSPGGAYRGAYQFDQGTWNGVVARMGRPDLVGVSPAAASAEAQDAAAQQLYSERGSQPWPYCGRYL